MKTEATISDYATPSPCCIGLRQTLGAAHRMMRELGVRHLPVIDAAGGLVGTLSQRDLYFLETLPGTQQEEVSVEEAMNPRPYVVRRGTKLALAAKQMWQRKLGCAVVVAEGRVVGIFTSNDALRALAGQLGAAPSRRSRSKRLPA